MNVNKSNHFWWLVSKSFLNKYLLEDSKKTLNEFVQSHMSKDSKEEDKENETDSVAQMLRIFDSQCYDFDSLTKGDEDLAGVEESLFKLSIPDKLPLLDDQNWNSSRIPSELILEEEKNNDDENLDVWRGKLKNASEKVIVEMINILDDKFMIESEDNQKALKWANKLRKTVPETSVEYPEK